MMTFTGPPARALVDVLMITTHHVAMTHIDALVQLPQGDEVYSGVSDRSRRSRGAP